MFEKARVWDVGIVMMVYVVELPLLFWLVDVMQLISSRGYQINRRMLNRINSDIKLPIKDIFIACCCISHRDIECLIGIFLLVVLLLNK